MKVLVIGSGGREHALCWKIKQSHFVDELFCATGNAGISDVATCVNPSNIPEFCKENGVDLVVVGSEAPLTEGIVDELEAARIPAFGPTKKAAQLEGSKVFMKNLCKKYDIPTAEYETFTDAQKAKKYLAEKSFPIVIKTDGLAAGKGVLIPETLEEAEQSIDEVFGGKFGTAGSEIVIEEYLDGEEVSVFYICNGHYAIELGDAQDHKRVGEGDTGLNTGGMGTYSPAPIYTDEIRKEVLETMIKPTLAGMEKEGCPFKGFLYAGIMITADGVKLLEYNIRMGDPETQVIMPRLKTDLIDLITGGTDKAELNSQHAMCVVMAADGYPEEYKKGSEIKGLDVAESIDDVLIFHAGTKRDGDAVVANGGRVLGVTGVGDDLQTARDNAYSAVDAIDWEEGFCRKDIGWRALKK